MSVDNLLVFMQYSTNDVSGKFSVNALVSKKLTPSLVTKFNCYKSK